MSLPVPIQGVHHMFGKVGVCTDEMFKGAVAKLVPVLGQLSSVPCVVLLPIPRYLKEGCCEDKTHATHAGTPGENLVMVEKLMHLRKLLRTELVASNCTGYWVPDLLENLTAPGVGAANNADDKAGKLKELFSSDCVHLTGLGYTRLAECTVESVKSTAERSRDTAELFVSGVRKSHYRRGFNSVRGGSRAAFTASGYKSRNTLSSAPGGRGSIPIGQRVVKGVVAAVTVCVATEIKKN